MKKFLLLFPVLLLCACVGGARNTAPASVYDFGLPIAQLSMGGNWSRMAIEVKSPAWFDSLNVDYRLAYDDPLKQREYAGSRWAAAPGVLLSQRLRQQLGAASATGNTAVDCLLRVELQEFSQIFDLPQKSRGVLLGKVTLIDAKRQMVAERSVVIEKSAATPDAQGGVNALVSASTELGQQLGDWLVGLPGRENSNICGSMRSASAKP